MEQVKATISSGYRWRLLAITALMLGFAAYCYYDWTIGYPHIKEVGLAYQQIKTDHPVDYPIRWPEVAADKGWSTQVPDKVKSAGEYDTDIFTQLIMLVITGSIGLYFLYRLIVESRRWIAMDEQGLTATGGRSISWSDLTGLDESRWKSKGIAYALYKDKQGRSRRLLLDDFKSDRDAIKRIVLAIQAHLRPEPVMGDEHGVALTPASSGHVVEE